MVSFNSVKLSDFLRPNIATVASRQNPSRQRYDQVY
jgi:hypothetical protein